MVKSLGGHHRIVPVQDSLSGLRIDVAWSLRRLPPWRWLLRARHRPALACTHAGAIQAVTEQDQYDGRAQSGGKNFPVHGSSPRSEPTEVAVAASAVPAAAVGAPGEARGGVGKQAPGPPAAGGQFLSHGAPAPVFSHCRAARALGTTVL